MKIVLMQFGQRLQLQEGKSASNCCVPENNEFLHVLHVGMKLKFFAYLHVVPISACVTYTAIIMMFDSKRWKSSVIRTRIFRLRRIVYTESKKCLQWYEINIDSQSHFAAEWFLRNLFSHLHFWSLRWRCYSLKLFWIWRWFLLKSKWQVQRM